MGRDGWLGVGWPVEYGGRGFGAGRAADLRQRGGAGRRPAALGHAADRRADAAGVRHRRSRRRASCRGSWPARSTSRSATPSRRRAPTSPRCAPRAVRDGDALRRQRAEDLHHRRATTPTTSGWPAAPTRPRRGTAGISILIVDTRDPGYSWTPIITCDGAHHVNATYYSDVRVPVAHAGGRGERRLAADHHPAQPRAGDARPGRPARGRCYDRVRDWAAERARRTACRC